MCKRLMFLVCFVVLAGVAFSPASAEIVGWWKFDEGSGTTANDSSGLGHTGNIQGTTSWVEGFVGPYAISLTGGYVLINDSSALRPPQFTVTAWVKLPSAQAAYARVLEKGYDNHETYNFQGGGYGMTLMVRDTGGGQHNVAIKGEIPENEWAFLAGVYDGSNVKIYLNGVLHDTNPSGSFTPFNSSGEPLCIGGRPKPGGVDRLMNGMVDDVRVYNHGMSDNDIKEMFAWISGDTSIAALPVPKHLAINVSPYTSLSWFPGKGATSHDVYLSTDFDDVNDATTGSSEFMGNVDVNSYDPGLLELGQTYYWRVDELSDGETSKGTVWQFTVDDGKASHPNPPDGLANTPVDANLSWTAGNYATSHDVYFGTDETAVADANTASPEYKGNQAETTYDPGTLEENVTYYWRIDEIGEDTFAKGHVWKFTTIGALHLQVDLALPRCSEAGIFTDPPVAGTLKEGWWPWVAGRWADMYSHDCVWERGESFLGDTDPGGIAGSGVHALLSCGYEGQGGLHVKGMCRCGLAGDCCPTGEAQGDPIANSFYYAVDWGGPDLGDTALVLTDLPPGKYQMISYHNWWEACSQSTRNCMDCICGMPPMPSVTAQGLPATPPEGYRGLCLAGTDTGVTAIQNAYDVPVTYNYSDSEVSRSVIEFATDGNEVLIIYEAPDWGYPDCGRSGREGGRGILNAFELILVEPAGPESWRYRTQCHGDTDDDGEVKGSDFLALKTSWYKCYPDPDYDPCADFDRDGCVKGSDFLILKSSWYQTVEPNCPSGGTWPPQP